MEERIKRIPREHHLGALNATKKNGKGIVNLPTSTGKTFVQTIVNIDSLQPGKVYVTLSPKILLANQLLTDTRQDMMDGGAECHYLNVHSGTPDEDVDLELMRDYNMEYRGKLKSTTSSTVIREEHARAVAMDLPLIISGTYHSAERIAASGVPVEILHCDEGHHLREEQFRWILRDGPYSTGDQQFPARRKYFYTATLRNGRSDNGIGMNNKTLFGDIIYQKKPIDMILAGEMLRPRLHFVDVEPLDQTIGNDKMNTDANAIIQSFLQHRTLCNTKIAPKMLVTMNGSGHLNGIVKHPLFVDFMKDRPELLVFDITSEHKPRINGRVVRRNEFFRRLRKMGNDQEAIIMHIKIITEGIDVPGITGVMLMTDCIKSTLLQNLGRAIRLLLEDRKELYDGTMRYDELDKFIKPYAYVILPIYGELGEDMRENALDMIYELKSYEFNPAEDIIMSDSLGTFKPEPIGTMSDTNPRARRMLSEMMRVHHQIESELKASELWLEDNIRKAMFAEMTDDEMIDYAINF